MKIQLKRSSVTEATGKAKAPSEVQMEYGELAVNYGTNDPAIFMKDSADNVIRISGREVPSDNTPPANPLGGNFWYNPTDGRLYIYYVDADSAQWVDASPDDWDPSELPDLSNPAVQPDTLDERYINKNVSDLPEKLTVAATDFLILEDASGVKYKVKADLFLN